MELLVLLIVLVALAVLALRFGQDTREGVASEEEHLARLGLDWGA